MTTHQRFRKFNTREAYPEQSLDNDVCMVVRANNTVYVRGQTAMDLDGKIVGIGDAAAQTENAMACAKVLLE
ncbi:MAG TPA: RidA family protein, partial [Bradyrhizobium sp.]|nr:RidA family protein [Bradyrhizobium sp.]